MKPNILFILIDSLRSDRCHGTKKTSKTPNLDDLIDKGILFTTSISPIASTAASLGSLFTGLFPHNTGMSDNRYEKLNSNLQNYVSLLEKQGYSTHATQSELTNLLDVTSSFKFQLAAKKHNNFRSLFDGLGKNLLDKLDSQEMKPPWIFYIHLNDLHQPISVPSEFADDVYGATSYDKMISAIDHWLGKIISSINLDETLVVITSDHGDYVRSITKDGVSINLEGSNMEKFLYNLSNILPPIFDVPKQKLASMIQTMRSNQRKSKISKSNLTSHEIRTLVTARTNPGHHMFDDTLVTPLLLCGYGVEKSMVIDQQIRNVDIFPTILQLCQISDTLDSDGKNLVPLINGETIPEEPAYIESMPSTKKNTKIIGIRTSKFKYFREKNGSTNPTLYDLKNDPNEVSNIAKNQPLLVDKMEDIFQKILKNSNKKKRDVLKDEERAKVEDELRKLGYI